MTEQQELTLEGYRNLSFWNKHDAQAVLSFDKIFLPASIGACAFSLANDNSSAQDGLSFTFVYPGAVLLLTFWLALSLRYRKRIRQRFDVMKEIELHLGFHAHSLLDDDAIRWFRDETLRKIFYFLTVVLGAVPLMLQWLTC